MLFVAESLRELLLELFKSLSELCFELSCPASLKELDVELDAGDEEVVESFVIFGMAISDGKIAVVEVVDAIIQVAVVAVGTSLLENGETLLFGFVSV